MIYNIKDFGALGDGQAMETKAIQTAISACANAGGGRVYFPNGLYMSASLELLDGVSLYFEKGATLKASPDLNDYKQLDLPVKEANICRTFLYAVGRSKVSLEGEGTIDLSDEAFNDFTQSSFSPALDKNSLDDEQLSQGISKFTYGQRPTLPIVFFECKDVTVKNLTIRHAPFWTLVFWCASNVFVTGIKVNNRMNTANCDGISIIGCDHVTVSDCQITSADDCIFIGCPNEVYGNRENTCQYITITNCVVRSRSSAVRIGYIRGHIRHLLINNLEIHDSNRGIIIQAIQDGCIESIIISNVVMNTRLLAGAWWGKANPLCISASGGKAVIRNIMVSNVIVDCETGLVFYGNPNGNIYNIVLRDWIMTMHQSKNRAVASFVDLEDEICPKLMEGAVPWLYCINVQNLRLENVQVFKAPGAEDMSIIPIEENSSILHN